MKAPTIVPNLKTRVRFEKRHVKSSDGYGNYEDVWTNVLSRWCDIRYLMGGESVYAARLEGKQPALIFLRKDTETALITHDYRAIVLSGAFTSSTNLISSPTDMGTDWSLNNVTEAANVISAVAASPNTFNRSVSIVPASMSATGVMRLDINITRGNYNFAYVALSGEANSYVAAVVNLASKKATQTGTGSTSGVFDLLEVSDNDSGGVLISIEARLSAISSPLLHIGFADGASGNTFTTLGTIESDLAGTEQMTIDSVSMVYPDTGVVYNIRSVTDMENNSKFLTLLVESLR